ncbi:hypothetical protein [Wolbachia endosymbiont of Cruorifilaria tuberocauda]|uniref:hypothetical protein n=1 Tax=Wolbachia endosymbiont of Cruorifilaria tuberocauda TaxID=1812111 RepID=UPI001FE39D70|nr:hypothetical protein [Wolbachia endosymbiont of Cruorifilaria tuberocauda]
MKCFNRIEIKKFGSFSIRSYKLKKKKHLVARKFTRVQYFRTYFCSSKKLSDLINE